MGGHTSAEPKRRLDMRFLSIYTAKESNRPPSPEHIAAIGKLTEEGMREGSPLGTGGCLPTPLGARIRVTNGQFAVKDGPFAESKEVVGGFALIQATSKEEGIEDVKLL